MKIISYSLDVDEVFFSVIDPHCASRVDTFEHFFVATLLLNHSILQTNTHQLCHVFKDDLIVTMIFLS